MTAICILYGYKNNKGGTQYIVYKLMTATKTPGTVCQTEQKKKKDEKKLKKRLDKARVKWYTCGAVLRGSERTLKIKQR